MNDEQFNKWSIERMFNMPSGDSSIEDEVARETRAANAERQRLANQFGLTLKGSTQPAHKPQVVVPSGQHIAITAMIFLAENNEDFTSHLNGKGSNIRHRDFIKGCYEFYKTRGYLSLGQIEGLCLGAKHRCIPATCGQPCPNFGKRTNEINGKTVSGLRFYSRQLMAAGVISNVNQLIP